MNQDYISVVLESLGWPTDENFIPVANEENRHLLEVINVLTENKLEKSKGDEILDDRLKSIKSHIDTSNLEIAQNLKIINARRNELDSESNSLKVLIHDEKSLHFRQKDVDHLKQELRKYSENTNTDVEKIKKNLEVLFDKIQWAKSAINEFQEAMSHGESSKMMIEKYCNKDNSTAVVLESKRKSIQAAINKQRQILINAHEEQKSLEQVLERTAQLYRQAHTERRQMVETWKEAVNQMNVREQNIQEVEVEYERASRVTTEKGIELKEQIEFYNQQVQNNQDTEKAIEGLNSINSKWKLRETEITEKKSLKINELAIVNKTVYNISTRLLSQRTENRKINSEKENKSILFGKEEERFAELKKKHETFKSRSFSAAERLKQIDELIETEEKNMKLVQFDITRISGALYRSQKQLKEFQDDEKLLQVEHDKIRSDIVNNKRNFKIQEKELLHQTESLYNVDFNLQQLEHRVHNMKGTGDDQNLELERKIVWLEETLAAKNRDLRLIDFQVSKIENDIRILSTNFTRDNLDYERLLNYLKERQMHAEGGEKDITRQIQMNQEFLVEQSILKMKVNQLEKEIKRQDTKNFNLEKHKIALDVAMKERLLEIKTKMNILLVEKKSLSAELSQLNIDISDRNQKIEALKARFECVMELLGRNEDGSMVTATQIKIEKAQEKHILLKEGNELNEKVLQAEKDIKAMENTLRVMNYSNENYKRKSEKVDAKDPMNFELVEVQEQFLKAVNKLKELQHIFSSKTMKLNKMYANKADLEKCIDDITRVRLDNNDVLIKIHKELIDQKVKMQRADRELKAAIKSCRQKVNDLDFMNLFEKDLLVKEIEERNSSALQQLADLVEFNAEIGGVISKVMFEKGIKMPQVSHTKCNLSYKSNQSNEIQSAGSAYSVQVMSASSKSSEKSTDSRYTSKTSIKTGLTPSVILIGFPGNVTTRSNVSTNRSSNKF